VRSSSSGTPQSDPQINYNNYPLQQTLRLGLLHPFSLLRWLSQKHDIACLAHSYLQPRRLLSFLSTALLHRPPKPAASFVGPLDAVRTPGSDMADLGPFAWASGSYGLKAGQETPHRQVPVYRAKAEVRQVGWDPPDSVQPTISDSLGITGRFHPTKFLPTVPLSLAASLRLQRRNPRRPCHVK